jgi:hypothetical protein
LNLKSISCTFVFDEFIERKRKPEKKPKEESRYRKSTNGQKKKRKREELPGNNNKGEIGDQRKATRLGRRRRMHGKESSHRQ